MSFLTPIGILPLYRNIDMLEKGFNVVGYVPIIGSLSGMVARRTLAIAEVVAGLTLAFFYAFMSFGNPLSVFYGQTAMIFLKHGILNALRSQIEIKPMASLFICFPFDFFLGRVFPYPI